MNTIFSKAHRPIDILSVAQAKQFAEYEEIFDGDTFISLVNVHMDAGPGLDSHIELTFVYDEDQWKMFNPFSNYIITANALFPLNDEGLRSDMMASLSIERNF